MNQNNQTASAPSAQPLNCHHSFQETITFLAAEARNLNLPLQYYYTENNDKFLVTLTIPENTAIGELMKEQITGADNHFPFKLADFAFQFELGFITLYFSLDTNGIAFLRSVLHNVTSIQKATNQELNIQANLAFCALIKEAFDYVDYNIVINEKEKQVKVDHQITQENRAVFNIDSFESGLIPLLCEIAQENPAKSRSKIFYEILIPCFTLFGEQLTFSDNDTVVNATSVISGATVSAIIDQPDTCSKVFNCLNASLYNAKSNLSAH